MKPTRLNRGRPNIAVARGQYVRLLAAALGSSHRSLLAMRQRQHRLTGDLQAFRY